VRQGRVNLSVDSFSGFDKPPLTVGRAMVAAMHVHHCANHTFTLLWS
jgi:hypothetical protein